jgi:hypothetical protein
MGCWQWGQHYITNCWEILSYFPRPVRCGKIRRMRNNKNKQSHTTPDLSGSLKLRYVHWRRQSRRKSTIKKWVQGNNRVRKPLKPKAPIHPILTSTQKENNNKKRKTSLFMELSPFPFLSNFCSLLLRTQQPSLHRVALLLLFSAVLVCTLLLL